MITDQLRHAIRGSGLTVNEVAGESGIPQAMLSRFMRGKDLRLSTADRLAEYFGLILRPRAAGQASADERAGAPITAAATKPSRGRQSGKRHAQRKANEP